MISIYLIPLGSSPNSAYLLLIIHVLFDLVRVGIKVSLIKMYLLLWLGRIDFFCLGVIAKNWKAFVSTRVFLIPQWMVSCLLSKLTCHLHCYLFKTFFDGIISCFCFLNCLVRCLSLRYNFLLSELPPMISSHFQFLVLESGIYLFG